MEFRLKHIGAWTYPEAEAKELRSVALLLEGRHALHGVGHHGHSAWAHLPTTPGVHQVGVPVYQNKSQCCLAGTQSYHASSAASGDSMTDQALEAI